MWFICEVKRNMKSINKKKIGIGAISILLIAFIFIGFSLKNSNQQNSTTTSETSLNDESTKTSKQSNVASDSQVDKNTKGTENSANSQGDNQLNNEDFSTMERPTIQEINEAQKHSEKMKDQFVGEIEIPSINLKLNILEGTTYQKMLYGATTLLPNSIMGHGNYALASHNMGVEGQMFTSIYKLQKGADIILRDQNGQSYRYKVVSNDVVDYKNTDKLNLTKKPTVTLVTCQSVQTTDNRVVVQAELV